MTRTPEDIRATQKKYRALHRETLLERKRRSYREHSAEVCAKIKRKLHSMSPEEHELYLLEKRIQRVDKIGRMTPDERERYLATQREKRQKYHFVDPTMTRRHWLNSKFKISLSDYDVKLKAQGGVCAICKKLPGKYSLSVDHNHETGQIRGLLCQHCNMMVGFFEKNDTTQINKYIESWKQKGR